MAAAGSLAAPSYAGHSLPLPGGVGLRPVQQLYGSYSPYLTQQLQVSPQDVFGGCVLPFGAG